MCRVLPNANADAPTEPTILADVLMRTAGGECPFGEVAERVRARVKGLKGSSFVVIRSFGQLRLLL